MGLTVVVGSLLYSRAAF